jgi:hypothetical protein
MNNDLIENRFEKYPKNGTSSSTLGRPRQCVNRDGVGSSVFGPHCQHKPAVPYDLNVGPSFGGQFLSDLLLSDRPAGLDETGPRLRSGAAIANAAPAANSSPAAMDRTTTRLIAHNETRGL